MMNKLGLTALLLVFSLSFFFAGTDYTVREQEQIRRSFPMDTASGSAKIIIDNVFGNVRVTVHDKKEVDLVCQKSIRARSNDLMKKAKEEVSLDIDQKSGVLDIYADGPFRSQDRDGTRRAQWKNPGYIVVYDFEVKIPRQCAIVLRTVTEGDITVSGVEGAFDVRNVNGKIVMEEMNGSGKAHTVNGKVLVSFTRNPRSECSFKTINGKIELMFPERPSADFRIKTFNGDAYTDFETTELPVKSNVTVQKNGGYRYKMERVFGVRTGTGGPEIKLDTLNGNIYLTKR